MSELLEPLKDDVGLVIFFVAPVISGIAMSGALEEEDATGLEILSDLPVKISSSRII